MYRLKTNKVVALNIAPQFREAFIGGALHDCVVYFEDGTRTTIKRVGQLTYVSSHEGEPSSMRQAHEWQQEPRQELEALFVNGLKISR